MRADRAGPYVVFLVILSGLLMAASCISKWEPLP